ncbi:MAG: hypothetical protein IJX17_07505 [Clostridia bacterium]|nr:hypothetical protein [Clostridia bacterium]
MVYHEYGKIKRYVKKVKSTAKNPTKKYNTIEQVTVTGISKTSSFDDGEKIVVLKSYDFDKMREELHNLESKINILNNENEILKSENENLKEQSVNMESNLNEIKSKLNSISIKQDENNLNVILPKGINEEVINKIIDEVIQEHEKVIAINYNENEKRLNDFINTVENGLINPIEEHNSIFRDANIFSIIKNRKNIVIDEPNLFELGKSSSIILQKSDLKKVDHKRIIDENSIVPAQHHLSQKE